MNEKKGAGRTPPFFGRSRVDEMEMLMSYAECLFQQNQNIEIPSVQQFRTAAIARRDRLLRGAEYLERSCNCPAVAQYQRERASALSILFHLSESRILRLEEPDVRKELDFVI